jgi:hypothetical protein
VKGQLLSAGLEARLYGRSEASRNNFLFEPARRGRKFTS